MDDRSISHGVLFYSSLYVNGILLITGITTGRWIFLLLILLTMGLTAYLMFLITNDADHLQKMGVWVESKLLVHLEKVKQVFKKV